MLKNTMNLLLIALVLALPTQLLSQQQAQQTKTNRMNMQQNNMPSGMQMGMPCPCCYHGMRGHGMMMNPNMRGKGMMMNPISVTEAKDIFANYIKNNSLKGYSIVSIKKFNSFRGPKYYAELKDSSGNLFTLVISHGNMVRGPFPASEIK